MRIAIPLADGRLALHFGHCEQFALMDVDPETGKILSRENVTPPPHEPGLLPRWLGEKKVNVILAGGMGQRALMLFDAQGIEVSSSTAWIPAILDAGLNIGVLKSTAPTATAVDFKLMIR
ncbi:MAG TPA: NifB/NifX family molybdenum-iron cluster-binding protein, partial [Candidatus Hydrogenedentes bacterium]|nr:NifB/NifX family molybdenum-iron cluster-binding protein [Candidatus Hydrogenedentota bacterium]